MQLSWFDSFEELRLQVFLFITKIYYDTYRDKLLHVLYELSVQFKYYNQIRSRLTYFCGWTIA